MKLYMAPMEGITASPFRNALHSVFPGADKFYTPFLSPDCRGMGRAGAMRDLESDRNKGIELIPQILCNNPETFLLMAENLRDMGFQEVNLNAGCPSGTVVPKHKGAGMLWDLVSFRSFLDRIFAACPLKISIKTRLGVESSDEFPEILELYNEYPVSELIIHARDRAGMYKSPVNLEAFSYALKESKIPLCYNGNIFSQEDYKSLIEKAPCECVMLGRGTVANPALFRILKGGEKMSAWELEEFLKQCSDGLLEMGIGEHFALSRLKEQWYYMRDMFPGADRELKAVLRSKRMSEYEDKVSSLIDSGKFCPEGKFRG